ncbi:hypothetical protein EDB83DRAFT_2372547 [Lactarius deliciosus]|nr:hypothetical protein EDB83DRAFT_2372547 [Lactarius deliciosus]
MTEVAAPAKYGRVERPVTSVFAGTCVWTGTCTTGNVPCAPVDRSFAAAIRGSKIKAQALGWARESAADVHAGARAMVDTVMLGYHKAEHGSVWMVVGTCGAQQWRRGVRSHNIDVDPMRVRGPGLEVHRDVEVEVEIQTRVLQIIGIGCGGRVGGDAAIRDQGRRGVRPTSRLTRLRGQGILAVKSEVAFGSGRDVSLGDESHAGSSGSRVMSSMSPRPCGDRRVRGWALGGSIWVVGRISLLQPIVHRKR